MKTKYFLLLLLAGMSISMMSFSNADTPVPTTHERAAGSYVYFHSYGSKANGNYESKFYISDIIWIDGDRYGEEFKAGKTRYEKRFKSDIISDHDDEADYVYMAVIPSHIKDKEGFELERAKIIRERKEKRYTVNQIYL